MGNTFHVYWQFPHCSDQEKKLYPEHISMINKIDPQCCRGSLVYFNHGSLDPWIIATGIIQNTTSHIPLVAMQPYTMNPATAAEMIHTITHLYSRKVNINLITGTYPKDLKEVGCLLDKSERYRRLTEFGTILKKLLSSNEPLTYQGEHYHYYDYHHNSAVDTAYMPEFFVPMLTGSQESISCISAIADTVVTLSKPIRNLNSLFSLLHSKVNYCVKFQIIARKSYEEAISAAKNDAPAFRTRQIIKINQSSEWSDIEKMVYFPEVDHLGPIIVGTYDQVASYLSEYLQIGINHFIIPNIFHTAGPPSSRGVSLDPNYPSIENLEHCNIVFDLLSKRLS